MRVQQSFVWSDAWVLASVAVGGGLKGCELKDIIAAGDLLNRAILSPAELRGALVKLIRAGHVKRSGEAYVIAGEARYAVEQLPRRPSATFNVMHFFEELLDVDTDTLQDAPAVNDASVADLTDVRVEAAIHAYQVELAALWRELRHVDENSLSERALRLLTRAARLREGEFVA
jgi:hypothetical protein